MFAEFLICPERINGPLYLGIYVAHDLRVNNIRHIPQHFFNPLANISATPPIRHLMHISLLPRLIHLSGQQPTSKDSGIEITKTQPSPRLLGRDKLSPRRIALGCT